MAARDSTGSEKVCRISKFLWRGYANLDKLRQSIIIDSRLQPTCMAGYVKLAWRHVVIRFLIDLAAAALIFIPTCVVAGLIFSLGHAAWGMNVRILKQSLSALAAVYLLVLLAGTVGRHWQLLFRPVEQSQPVATANSEPVAPNA